MPQKGLKKVMGLGEAEKTFLKSFFRFPIIPSYQSIILSPANLYEKIRPACRSVRRCAHRNNRAGLESGLPEERLSA